MPRRRFLNEEEIQEVIDGFMADDDSEHGDDDYLLDMEAREAGYDVSDDEDEQGELPDDAPDNFMEDAYDDMWCRAFDHRVGPLLREPLDEVTPSEVFSDFLTADIIDRIVVETNRYADQYFRRVGGKDNLPPRSRARSWIPTDPSEMKAVLGIIMYTGLVRLPAYNLYWSTNSLLNLGIKSVMSRDRFLQVLSFLHLVNNEEAPEGDDRDRLFKVRGVMDMFTERWAANFYPGREVSVDETVIAFKGRTRLTRYNPNKPHKWGMVAWSLCDANTGYVQNWNISTGQEVQDNERGAMHQVVMDVSADYLNNGHHIYMDNLFSSPSLFEELARNDTGACGTLRPNRRGVPEIIKAHKPKKDDPPLVVKEGDLTYISWADKRPVRLITSVHNGNTFIKEVRAKNGPDHRRRYVKPKAIEHYSQNMGGVDLADQLLWHSLNIHRSCKWWKKIFFALLEVSFCNAVIVLRALNSMKPAHQRIRIDVNKVRLSIITGLLEEYERPHAIQMGPRLEDEQPLRRLTEKHFPANNPKRKRDGKPCFRDCEVCSNRDEKRHQTSTVCRDCGNIPLCDKPCFRLYHTLRKYKTICTPALHLEIDNVQGVEQ